MNFSTGPSILTNGIDKASDPLALPQDGTPRIFQAALSAALCGRDFSPDGLYWESVGTEVPPTGARAEGGRAIAFLRKRHLSRSNNLNHPLRSPTP
jgi:hypothetical protein